MHSHVSQTVVINKATSDKYEDKTGLTLLHNFATLPFVGFHEGLFAGGSHCSQLRLQAPPHNLGAHLRVVDVTAQTHTQTYYSWNFFYTNFGKDTHNFIMYHTFLLTQILAQISE